MMVKKSLLPGKSLYYLLATSAVFFVIELYFAGQKELWLDETHSSLLASMTFSGMLDFVKGDVHPPLYFISIWIWESFFGDTPYSLRIFSVLMHISGSIVFLYVLRKITSNSFTTITGYVLFLLSPVLFWYSVEVRMYAQLVLLTNICMLVLLTIMKSDRPPYIYALYLAISLSLTFYTHYSAIFFVIGVFLFLSYKTLTNFKAYFKVTLLAGIATLILTVPWYGKLLEQREIKLNIDQQHIDARSDPSTLEYKSESKNNRKQSITKLAIPAVTSIASIAGIYSSDYLILVGLSAIPFILLLVPIIQLIRNRDDTTVFSVIVIGTCLAGSIFLLGLTQRRYMILLAPFILLLMVNALRQTLTSNKPLAVIIGLALTIMYVAGSTRILLRDYAHPVISLVNNLNTPENRSSLIIVNSIHGQIPIEYYAKQASAKLHISGFPISIHDWWKEQSFKGWGSPVIKIKDLTSYFDKLKNDSGYSEYRLVLFESHQYDPGNMLTQYLKNNKYTLTDKKVYVDTWPDSPVYTTYKVSLP